MNEVKDLINYKLANLMREIDYLNNEKASFKNKIDELDVRTHQVVGAVYELQALLEDISRANQPFDPSKMMRSEVESHQPLPSEGADLNIHQEPLQETETNSQQPS